MDPLTLFVLTVAEQVLSGVLVNVLSGRRSAKKRQVEEEAATIVRKAAPELSRKDLDLVVHRVLTEVRYLTNEHPDLEWNWSGVSVLPEVPSKRKPEPAAVKETVQERLDRLHRIVSLRRKEIDLSAPLEPSVPAQVSVERVSIARDPSYWTKRLAELQQTVQSRQQDYRSEELERNRDAQGGGA
jgi:hypothetical protein